MSEKERIEDVINYLVKRGFTNVLDTEKKFNDRFHCYDIYGEYNDLKIGFEVKVRSCNSTKYGDAVIEYNKYKAIKEKIKSREIDYAYLVYLFADKSYIIRLTDDFIQESVTAKRTTYWTSNYIDKTFISYKLDPINEHKI